jgi:hypothetical protein
MLQKDMLKYSFRMPELPYLHFLGNGTLRNTMKKGESIIRESIHGVHLHDGTCFHPA